MRDGCIVWCVFRCVRVMKDGKKECYTFQFSTRTLFIFSTVTALQLFKWMKRKIAYRNDLRSANSSVGCVQFYNVVNIHRGDVVRASINRSTPDCNFPLRFFLVASFALYRSQFNSIILHTTSLLIHLMPTSILFANSHNNANSCWSLLKATDDCSSLE